MFYKCRTTHYAINKNFASPEIFLLLGGMPMKPMPIRFTREQDARLTALAASGEFTKQELVRLAVEKLFELLDAGEEVVVQKVLRKQAAAPRTQAGSNGHTKGTGKGAS